MAMPARVQRKDAEILKNDFNCNIVRCSHYPQSPDFLDACDELGLLVWEEAPGWHNVSTTPAWQDLVVQNVRDMVIRDRSRPSVVIWGTRLNETPDFPRLWAATRQAAKELDSSRPSSGAMAFHQHVTWNEDVFAYNDYGTDPKTGNIALKPPFAGALPGHRGGRRGSGQAAALRLDGSAGLARPGRPPCTARRRARRGPTPGYAGLLAWAGFDYASVLGQDRANIKWAGVADGFRVPKPGAAIYQTQGDPAVRPLIIPVFFWEAAGAVPAASPTAMIASNCEQLEVFVDGTHVASALPAFGSPLYSGLIHPPFLVRLPKLIPNATPELLVQGFVGGGRGPAPDVANPAGDALGMASRRRDHTADGSDATRAVFRAIDAYGISAGTKRRRHADPVRPGYARGRQPVRVWPVRRARRGVDPLAGPPAGAITLTASHPLLGQAEVQVRSEHANQANVRDAAIVAPVRGTQAGPFGTSCFVF